MLGKSKHLKFLNSQKGMGLHCSVVQLLTLAFISSKPPKEKRQLQTLISSDLFSAKLMLVGL